MEHITEAQSAVPSQDDTVRAAIEFEDRVGRFKAMSLLDITSVTDTQTKEQLRDRILLYVQYEVAINQSPIKLATINRRYGRHATKLGTTTRDLLVELHSMGQIQTHMKGTSVCVIDQEFLSLQARSLSHDETDIKLAIERMLDHAK